MQAHEVVGFTPQGQTHSGDTDPTINSLLTMPHGIQRHGTALHSIIVFQFVKPRSTEASLQSTDRDIFSDPPEAAAGQRIPLRIYLPRVFLLDAFILTVCFLLCYHRVKTGGKSLSPPRDIHSTMVH